MTSFFAFLKQWTLVIALAAGIIGHGFFSRFAWTATPLLMTMLFLTFTRLSPRELRFHPLHGVLLAIQVAGTLASWFLLSPVDRLIAQDASLCFFIPTATAAATICSMLGGNMGFLVTYTFLSSFAIVAAAPLVIPVISSAQAGIPFLESAMGVFSRIAPTMLLPLAAAWGLRFMLPRAHDFVRRHSGLSYYLWAAMLLVLIGTAFETLLSPGEHDRLRELAGAATGAAVCIFGFAVGRRLGTIWNMPIAAGQGLAQKNLLLGMWITVTYMDTGVLVCLALYSVFQNVYNAFQLWRHARQAQRIHRRSSGDPA